MYLIALQANLIAYGKIGKGKKVDREGEQMAIKNTCHLQKLSFKMLHVVRAEIKLDDEFQEESRQ